MLGRQLIHFEGVIVFSLCKVLIALSAMIHGERIHQNFLFASSQKFWFPNFFSHQTQVQKQQTKTYM